VFYLDRKSIIYISHFLILIVENVELLSYTFF